MSGHDGQEQRENDMIIVMNKDNNNNHDTDNQDISNPLQKITKEIEEDPRNWILYYKRFLEYSKISQYNEALEDLDRILTIHPENSLAMNEKSAILLQQKKFPELEAFLKQQNEIMKRDFHSKAVNIKQINSSIIHANYSISMKEPDDLECILCMKIFYMPITLPCGHTFCKSCIQRLLDHDDKCPFCRQLFYINPDESPINIVIKNIVEKNFSSLLEERKKEIEEMNCQITSHLPLFLMNSVCFPGEDLPLHIFEPRYRLLISRVLQSSRLFGMIGVEKEGEDGITLCRVGCILRIVQCEVLPDGRSLIHTRGYQRFTVEEHWIEDGYFCGKIKYVKDTPPSSSEMEEVKTLITGIRDRLTFLSDKFQGSKHCGGLNILLQQISSMPPMPVNFEQCEDYSFWLCKVLPLHFNIKQSLLECSLLERLNRMNTLLQNYESPHSCSIL